MLPLRGTKILHMASLCVIKPDQLQNVAVFVFYAVHCKANFIMVSWYYPSFWRLWKDTRVHSATSMQGWSDWKCCIL